MAWSLIFHKNTIRNCSTALQAFSFRSLSFYQKQPTEAFCKKKGAVRNFAKFTGKQLCQSLFFSLCEFCGISKNTFFTEHLSWLLLSSNIYLRSNNSVKQSIILKSECLQKLEKYYYCNKKIVHYVS